MIRVDISVLSSLPGALLGYVYLRCLKNKDPRYHNSIEYRGIEIPVGYSLNRNSLLIYLQIIEYFKLYEGDQRIFITSKYLSDYFRLRGKNNLKVSITPKVVLRSLRAVTRPFLIFFRSLTVSLFFAIRYRKPSFEKIAAVKGGLRLIYSYVSDNDLQSGSFKERYKLAEFVSSSYVTIPIFLLPYSVRKTSAKLEKDRSLSVVYREAIIGISRCLKQHIFTLFNIYIGAVRSRSFEAYCDSVYSSLFEATKNIEFTYSLSKFEFESCEIAMWDEEQDHQDAIRLAFEKYVQRDKLLIYRRLGGQSFFKPSLSSLCDLERLDDSVRIVWSDSENLSCHLVSLIVSCEIKRPLVLLPFTATPSYNDSILKAAISVFSRQSGRWTFSIKQHPLCSSELDSNMLNELKTLGRVEYCQQLDWERVGLVFVRNSSIQDEAYDRNVTVIHIYDDDLPMIGRSALNAEKLFFFGL